MKPNNGSQAAETPLAYRAVRGGMWVALSSYWTIGFGFVANIVLTRLLSPQAFGGFALAIFFAQLLRLQPKLGLGYAFAQYKDTTGESLGTYILMDSSAGLGGLLLTLLAAPILLRLGYTSIIVQVSVVLALSVFLEGIAGMGGMLLDKELRFGQTSLIQSLVFPMSYIPAFWLATHDGGIWSLAAQSLTYNVLASAGMWWLAHRHLPHIWQMRWQFSPSLARQFFGFGITVGLALLAGMLLTQLDNFLIGTLVSVTVLGFYDRAYRTAQWPSTLLNSLIARTAFYTYTRLQDDRVRLQKAVTIVLWLITTLALPLALVIFVTAPDLLVLLYGERWLPSAFFLRVLVLYSVMRPLWENAGALFVAIGKPRLTTVFTVIQVLVLATSGLPLTIAWGALGTCIAVGLAFAVGMALIYRNVKREMPIQLGPVLGPPALISALILLGYLALNRLTGLNALPLLSRAAIKSLYAVAMFFALTFITAPKTTRQRLEYIWRLASRAGE